MKKIATLNKISPKGLNLLTDDYEIIDEPEKADGILVRSQDMHEMDFSADLLAIARAGAGVNNIPVDKCAENGIVVFNTPGANANAVKELVLSGMLMAARNIPDALTWVYGVHEDVSKTVEKNKSKFVGEELKGRTLGVIGLGFIGILVANAAESLGMKVIGYDPYISVQNAHYLSPSVKIYDEMESMLPHCDYLTVHVPAMKDTEKMINADSFALMKNRAVLLNFSRDKIVDEKALIDALEEKKIKRYVTDFPNDGLVNVRGVIRIPHLGASTKESEENCAIMAVEQVMDYIENGNIKNSVNYPDCSAGQLATESRVCILNKNIPSMLGQITGKFADMKININNLTNKSKGDYAYTLVDVDDKVKEEDIRKALDFEGIISLRVL